MYVIIPASDLEAVLCPLSDSISKTFVPINGKPIIQYILDELYSYQEYIDEIVIAKKHSEDIKEYMKYNSVDEFLKTKIHIVETTEYKDTSNPRHSILDDFYCGLSHLVDNLGVNSGEILVWSGDELVKNSRKLTDLSIGSFACTYNKEPIKIWRFNNFPIVVNMNIRFKETSKFYTMKDFVDEYSKSDEIIPLENFGDYYIWQDKKNYYDVQSKFIEEDEHSKYNIKIDFNKQQITKINKYKDLEYSYENHIKNKFVQSLLYKESDVLSNLDSEQKIFMPELIDTGITYGGDYINELTEEYFFGYKLSSILLNESLSCEKWNKIFTKLFDILSNVFHKDYYKYEDYSYNFVKSKTREKYISYLHDKYICIIDNISKIYSMENVEENYFVFDEQMKAEWKIFIDKFFDFAIPYFNIETLIYENNMDRVIHGNLLFENILFDPFTFDMKFIDPVNPKHKIVWKYEDYACLFASTVCGLTPLLKNKFIDENNYLSIKKSIFDNMKNCEKIFKDHFKTNEFKMIKMFSMLYILDMISCGEIDIDHGRFVLRYLEQIKKELYFEFICS